LIVYITRHGQIDEVTPCSPQGYRLSALGRRQAEKLGARLQELQFSGKVFVSPFPRCLETAQIVCDIVGLRFQPEAHLCEIARGWMEGFKGLTAAEICSQYNACVPEAQLPWPWWPEEEETDDDVLTRVKPFLTRLVADERHDVLLIGHGASAGAAFRGLSGEWGDFCNAALAAIRIRPTRSVLWYPDTSHLGPGEVTQNARVIA
jgi:broad specificity phosphatase PhoE